MSSKIHKAFIICGVSALALAVVPLSADLPLLGMSAAMAKGGDDSGSGHGGDSGSDDHGGSGDNSGSGSRHSGDDDDDDDDNSGRHGRHHAQGHDDDDDDRRGRRGRGRGGDDDFRDEVPLSVSEASLQGLLNGSLIAIDDLGRRLEVEIEIEHGVRTVMVKPHRSTVRTTPGPITSVSVVPAAQ